MQNEHFVNLTKLDWTDHNLSILKFCKEEAYKAVLAHTADYPATPHLPVVRGVMGWDRLDYFLDTAAKNNLFEGITSRWVDFQGAPILELRGKYTSLTACHVLSRDDKPRESAYGYRKNNRAKNEKNQELFQEIEASVSEDELLHIILLHGGRNDNFAYLRIYLEDSDIPALSENIMLMESPEMTPETESVPTPMPTLKEAIAKPEILSELPADTNKNVHSQS